ncbi:sn-glycerol-3-phosphate ABC transporter ATP-binding protein UgpC [bacterium]|nr:sn-glycerol-3-phosphate ABC transporter ATP-binding protein UgpC [bacterium]
MSTLSFKEIKKTYDGKNYIIKGVNLSINDGEFVVFVGPSGCGKSTMLRMIAGLETITSGELMIDEEIVNDFSPQKRGTAMVFQSYALYPHMTIKENLEFSLKLKKVEQSTIDKKVKHVSTMLDLDPYLTRKPSQLSGGQRQRVAIGRAVIREPKVLLFDEPLSNLDAKLRGRMRFEISKLHQNLKNTIIYVTHDQVEAMTLANRIVVFNDGHIQQVGAPMELYQKPSNLFVAGFIGSPQINTFEMELKDGKLIHPNFTLKDKLDITISKITVAVRPEHIVINPENYDVEATVALVETLGNETIIWVTLDDLDFKVRLNVSESGIKEGDKLKLQFLREHIHYFNTETEERLF